MLLLNKLFTFVFGFSLLIFINLVPPINNGAIGTFFVLLFCVIFFSTNLFLPKVRLSIIVSSYLFGLILMQYLQIFTSVNLILLSLIAFVLTRWRS